MLGFLLFHQLFWTEDLNYTKCLPAPSFSSCAIVVWDWNYLNVEISSQYQEEEGKNAINYLQLLLFIRYKRATEN